MIYPMKTNDNGDIIKKYETDEYENINVSYIDETLKDVDEFNLFKNLMCYYKLQLSINKELYKQGQISKKLYEKVEDILLKRLKPISAIIET